MPTKSPSGSEHTHHSSARPAPSATEKEFLPINREELERAVREREGDDWVEKNRDMLDAQLDYIDSL